jgi:ribosomal protein S27AE
MSPDCNREWTRSYISTKFSNNFVNTTLKKHREKILFDRERALLPATQPIIEEILRKERVSLEMRNTLTQIADLRAQYEDLRQSLFLNKDCKRAVFIRACPDEVCRGFLSSQWKCGLCLKWTCPTCHVIKGPERDCNHECKPDDVATATLLNGDTKPCPKCGEGIFKIDGCDQMWCTQCHTAFSWRTGHIENVVHNPHYYEYRRRQGTLERNPVDNPCPREVMDHRFHDIICNKLLTISNREQDPEIILKLQKKSKYISRICRNLLHLRHVDLERYRYNYEDNNRNVRIQYMRNFISEDQFKILLQQQDKRNDKNREIHDILQMVVDTVTDIIFRFNDEIKKRDWVYTPEINNYTKEIHQIVDYANECLMNVSKTYSSVTYKLDEKLVFS